MHPDIQNTLVQVHLDLGNDREAGNLQSREVKCDSGNRMQLPIPGAGLQHQS